MVGSDRLNVPAIDNHHGSLGGGGGRLFESRPPPIPYQSRPPKFFEPVFLQFEIFGETASAGDDEKNFHLLRGNLFFLLPYVSILKTLRILWRIQKMGGTNKKIFTPDLTSGSDLG